MTEDKGFKNPTERDIESIFVSFITSLNLRYSTIRLNKDSEGSVYLWEVKVNLSNGFTQYSYMRKGEFEEYQSSETVIDMIFFDSVGKPYGGSNVAKYIDGRWILSVE